MYHSFVLPQQAPLQYIQLGSGSPIVFLHGFGMEAAQWLPFAAPLAKNHTVIIPDLRGFGRSHLAKFTRECVITDFALDLEDLLEHLGIRSFKLVGISMGALTALKYIELFGDNKLNGYFHIDQSPKCINDETWQWGLFGQEQSTRLSRAQTLLDTLQPYLAADHSFRLIPKSIQDQLAREFGAFFSTALSSTWHKKLVGRLFEHQTIFRKLVRTENWPAYVHCFKAYLEKNYDLRQALMSTRVPIEVIVGMKSEMYPPPGQLRIADYATNSRVLTYEKSGHTPLIDQPLRLMRDLKRFAAS